jgi:hypothetical protein
MKQASVIAIAKRQAEDKLAEAILREKANEIRAFDQARYARETS